MWTRGDADRDITESDLRGDATTNTDHQGEFNGWKGMNHVSGYCCRGNGGNLANGKAGYDNIMITDRP